MTTEEARLQGEVHGLRIALRLVVTAMSADDKGPEIIALLRREALEVVNTPPPGNPQCYQLSVFDAASRDAVEFIFSPTV
ncbi:hypothetical protein [Rhodopseudomonas palustris]|uniref:hypothetical protein n=1 Tax=Rhodopseudomonas palustris TaxID=1076 RepID=UPI00105779F4|nr:hypothetical protein [Rhodopseudomonas palustris]